ncbi:MAG: peptidoglycan editing factor PgeF [Lachnospiraceae bacterium]|jgi:YfiH family protein
MEYLTFESIEKTGIARAVYTPMGVGGWGLNAPEDYINYELLSGRLNITTGQMIRTRQLHTANVRIVTAENGGEGVIRPVTDEGFDGLITADAGLMLCTVEADCVPVYLLDPVNKVIAMLHSGWKGTAGMIAANALETMASRFGTNPADVVAAMGPCICGGCYEVNKDLKIAFSEKFSKESLEKLFTLKPNGRYLLDLKEAVYITLTGCGVPRENIEDSGFCTYHSGMFYSWRRDANPEVRMLTGIMLL